MEYVLKYEAFLNTCDYGVLWHWEGDDPKQERLGTGEIRVSLDDWDASVVGPLVVSRFNEFLGNRLSDEVLFESKIRVTDWDFELRVLEDRGGNVVYEVLDEKGEDVRAIYVALEYALYLDHGEGEALEQISTSDVFDIRLDELGVFSVDMLIDED